MINDEKKEKKGKGGGDPTAAVKKQLEGIDLTAEQKEKLDKIYAEQGPKLKAAQEKVNASLTETLARSINTSLTVVITVVALLLLGGVGIRSFLLVLLIGIISGTYSSIGVASQILVAWEEGDFSKLWRRSSCRRKSSSFFNAASRALLAASICFFVTRMIGIAYASNHPF